MPKNFLVREDRHKKALANKMTYEDGRELDRCSNLRPSFVHPFIPYGT